MTPIARIRAATRVLRGLPAGPYTTHSKTGRMKLTAQSAEVIDWIETELNDDDNFRDIPEILAEARTRFVGAATTRGHKGSLKRTQVSFVKPRFTV